MTNESQVKTIASNPLRTRERKDRVRPPFASDEKRREALKLFEEGLGYTKVSRILNLPANTLRDWHDAFRKGRFRTTLSPQLFRYSEQAREEAVRMRLSGATWNEITEKTGISSSTCRRWLDDYAKKPGRKRRISLVRE